MGFIIRLYLILKEIFGILDNVDMSGVSDGDVLTWDSASSTWTAEALSEGGVEEYDTLGDFPTTGESGKLYLAKDTEILYRWDSSVYVEVSTTLVRGSVDVHSDVDVSSDTPDKNDILMWNGTNFVPVPEGTTFTFSCTSFSDGESSPQLIGSGTFKATGDMTYSATYENGPPTTADVMMSTNGGTYTKVGEMTGDGTSGTNTVDISYPSDKDQYLRFRLDSSDGTDSDIDYDSAIYFRNYIKWGVATKNSGFTASDVTGLSGGALSNDHTRTVSLSPDSTQYLVFAHPSSYTQLHDDGFIYNGITCPFGTPETVSVTNANGYTEDYLVYASDNLDLGAHSLTTSTTSTLIDPLYYGVTTKTSGYTESDVEGLENSEITNDNTQVWDSVFADTGEYLLFAFPVRLGTVTFYVGGFEGGFEDPEAVSVTNANGYTEDYYVWRSTNSGLGDTIVETK